MKNTENILKMYHRFYDEASSLPTLELSNFGYACPAERMRMREGLIDLPMRPNRFDKTTGILWKQIEDGNVWSGVAEQMARQLANRDACYFLHGALNIPQCYSYQPDEMDRRL